MFECLNDIFNEFYFYADGRLENVMINLNFICFSRCRIYKQYSNQPPHLTTSRYVVVPSNNMHVYDRHLHIPLKL